MTPMGLVLSKNVKVSKVMVFGIQSSSGSRSRCIGEHEGAAGHAAWLNCSTELIKANKCFAQLIVTTNSIVGVLRKEMADAMRKQNIGTRLCLGMAMSVSCSPTIFTINKAALAAVAWLLQLYFRISGLSYGWRGHTPGLDVCRSWREYNQAGSYVTIP